MDSQTGATRGYEPLMTEKEMATYLRIRPRQLFNWRMDGLIPYIRIGRSVRYRRSAVDAALERTTQWSPFGAI
jgi:excisionase family DNA binding protein